MTKTPRHRELDRPLRVGLVGLGKVSRHHLAAIASEPSRFELVAICESDRRRIPDTGDLANLPCFDSLQPLLAASGPDVISICTPSGLHAEAALEAARAGVHVITEKPMATSLADARTMIEGCDAAGVELFVVNQCRFDPTYQLLHRAIREGRFGRIFMSQANVLWSRPQSYYDADPWRGTIDLDGGALMNQAIHYLDLLHWLVGPIARVHAMTETLARKIETEDSAVLNLRLEDGGLGSVSVTTLAHRANFETSLTILGENGTVRIGGTSAHAIETWEFADRRPYDEQCRTRTEEPHAGPSEGHRAFYANVADSLEGRGEALTNGRVGLRSLEIVCAAILSSREGREVDLPLLEACIPKATESRINDE
ncbi:Gfo/Idh/MocA family oxidoreductase [Phycisphaerales bacterium]|nr:Gfo/Idh/MocA family oxidoreductase [Phycisphaerales bacterium]RPG14987.1 MAG: gfo/Idh/MocA family oxidoreductase [Phycisphaera sp. TMED9]